MADPAICIDCERSTGGACPRHSTRFYPLPPIAVFTQPEAYLQRALRRLTAAVEGEAWERR